MGYRIISDSELKAAAQKVVRSMAAALPEPPEYEFSEGFLAKMAKLIARSKESHNNRNIPKRIAAAIAVILLSLALALSMNPEARAAIKGWFRDAVDGIFNYWVEEEPEINGPMDYQLGWVPEGYELLVADSNPFSTTYLYQINTDPPTDWITFTYTQLDPETPANIIPLGEEYRIEQIVIWGKYTGELIISTDGQDTNSLIWIDTDRSVVFSISSYLGEENILTIAEKIIATPRQ